MNELFELEFGKPNDILGCDYPVLTASILSDDKYMLANADVPLIARSAFCKNNSKIMTRDEIITHDHLDYSNIEVADKQLVVFIPEPSKYIANEFIHDIDTYIEVIEIVMKYDMSIAYFYTKCEYSLWYIMIKEKSNMLWARNAKILALDTSGVFEIKKLRVAASLPGNNTAGNYPANVAQRRAVPVLKSLALKPRDRFSSSSIVKLINILIDTSAISVLDRIVAIIGTSVDHFDIIWSDASIMELLRQHSTILSSVIWYNMRIMHLEYMSSIRTSTVAHRHIINGKVAALLPQSDVKQFTESIYYTEIMKGMNHKVTLPSLLGTYRGIYTYNDFIKRFDQFTDNSLTWVHGLNGEFELEIDDTTTAYKFYITGSAMTACLIKNPLEHGFETLNEYFEEYYPSRYSVDSEFLKSNKQYPDIDTEIKQSTLFDIVEMIDYHDDNDNDDDDDDSDDNYRYEVDSKQKTTDEIKQLKSDDKYYGTTDIDIAVECDSFETLTDIVNAMIDLIKQTCKQSITMTKTSNRRYAIDGLHRRIEVFMVKSGPAIIGSFHLPCVRAWYDGSDTFMFVDFITAAYAGINLNLLWTSSSKDARSIILKYYQRGFSMLLNRKDTKALVAYINAQDTWMDYQYNGNYWARRRFKQDKIYHNNPTKFFNPSMYKHGIHANLDTNPTYFDYESAKNSKFTANVDKKILQRDVARSSSSFVRDVRYITKYNTNQGIHLPKLHPRLLSYL